MTLFDESMLSGDLSSISQWVTFYGSVISAFISFIGFNIVLTTIGKNALHGLYYAFPKFFDKVDEAHKIDDIKLENMSSYGGIKKNVKSIGTMILGAIPNIKAMTDFDGDGPVTDPKAYFMKAVPSACFAIFLGVFIFNGYTAKVAQFASTFGTEVIDVFLNNVDPIAWVDALPTKFTRLELATDGSKDDFDVAVNEATKKSYNTFVGYLDDITSEDRVKVSLLIEDWVIGQFEGIAEYTNDDAYTMTVETAVRQSVPDISRIHDQHIDNTHSFAFYKELSDFNSGTTKEDDGRYLLVKVQFKDKATTSVTTKISSTMTVRKGRDESGEYKITLGSSSTARINIMRGEVTVKVNDKGYYATTDTTGQTLILKPMTGSPTLSGSFTITNTSGIAYVVTNNGETFTSQLSSIKVDGTSDASFVSNDENNPGSWEWGTSLTVSNSSGNTSGNNASDLRD